MKNSVGSKQLKSKKQTNDQVDIKESKSIDFSRLAKEMANFSPRVPLTFYLATRKAIREKNSR